MPTGPRRGIGEAVAFIRADRTMATLLLVGFGNSFAFGAVLGLLVPYAVDELSLGADDARVGVLYGAIGVGSLVSGLVFARLFAPSRVPVLTPSTLALSGAVALALAVTSAWLPAIGLVIAFSASITTTIVVGITYRQLVAPDHLRSSVNVIGRMVAWGGQPFGAVTGAVVGSLAGVDVAYAVSGMILLVTAVAARALLAGHAGPRSSGRDSSRNAERRAAAKERIAPR